MNKQILLVALLVSGSAIAQQFDEATNTVIEPEAPTAAAPAAAPNGARNPIFILNNVRPSVQEQPTTVVEASPLSESRAEKLRKKRQAAELATEQQIVEKLEEARMEDERARADRLFGNGFNSNQPTVQAAPAPVAPVVVTQPEAVVVAPAPVPMAQVSAPVTEEAKPSVDVRSEVRAALDEYKQEQKPVEKNSYFVGALVGMADYPSASNVKGNIASGVTVGVVTDKRVVVEASFLYSDYEMNENPNYNAYSYLPQYYGVQSLVDVTQYNIGAALKYQLLPGKLRPFAGGILSYTRRTFATNAYVTPDGFVVPNYGSKSEGASDAFDAGATAGLDLQLTDTLTVSGEFRYMTNVSYRRDSQYSTIRSYFQPTADLEEIEYYSVMVGGKFTF